jgi:phage terminase large subunit-like protein
MSIPTNISEKAIWFNKLLDPADNCKNLRAFCLNIFDCKLEKNQYWALRDMLDPRVRFIYLSNARQAGKTHTIALFQAIAALFPEFVIPDYAGKGNAYVFAPKKEQAEISFERFSNFVHFNKYNIYSDSIITDKFDKMTFRNGFEVRAITASRNAEIEGLTSFIIIADESQAISPYKFRESIAPMGGGIKGGAKIIQCGVPGILGSHFHKAYKNKYDPQNNPSGYIHHVYPWKECPRLDLNYIMNIKSEDPDSFERNYELKWERSNYGYFMTYDEYEACEEDYDVHEMFKKAIENNWAIYWGIDFAKLRDSTVLTMVAQNPENGHYYVIGDLIEFQGTEYIDQIGYIKNIYIPGHIKHTCADKSGVGEMPIEVLNDGGILTTGINFSLQSKDKIYKHLRYQIQNKLIHWPKKLPNKEYRKFKQQLLELEIEHKTTGLISVHHNLDDNLARDDYADALCLAIWSAAEYVEPNISFI